MNCLVSADLSYPSATLATTKKLQICHPLLEICDRSERGSSYQATLLTAPYAGRVTNVTKKDFLKLGAGVYSTLPDIPIAVKTSKGLRGGELPLGVHAKCDYDTTFVKIC